MDGAALRHLPNLAVKSRVTSLLLLVGWLVPWLFAFGTGRAWWIPPISGMALLWLASKSRPVFLGSVVVAGCMGLGLWAGGVLGAVTAGLASAGGWLSYAPEPRTGLPTRLIFALMALATLVMWQPHWWPVLPAALAVGVVGLAEAERPPGVQTRDWWGLGTAFVVAALGVAVLVFTLSPRTTPGPAQQVPVLPVQACLVCPPPRHGRGFRTLPTVPVHLTLLWIALGLGLVVIAAWWIARMRRVWNPESRSAESEVVRTTERYEVRSGFGAHEGPEVRHTRRYVRHQLNRTRHGRAASHPSETVREWMSRVFERPAAEVVQAYEEVRYGRAPDSAERASWVAQHWPSRWALLRAGPNRAGRTGRRPDQEEIEE